MGTTHLIVGPVDVCPIPYGADSAFRNDGLVQYDDMVEVFFHRIQMVVDDDERLAFLLELLHYIDDQLFGGDVDPLQRFIHDVYFCILGDGAGNEYTLLLAARKLGYLTVSEALHLHRLEWQKGRCSHPFCSAA